MSENIVIALLGLIAVIVICAAWLVGKLGVLVIDAAGRLAAREKLDAFELSQVRDPLESAAPGPMEIPPEAAGIAAELGALDLERTMPPGADPASWDTWLEQQAQNAAGGMTPQEH